MRVNRKQLLPAFRVAASTLLSPLSELAIHFTTIQRLSVIDREELLHNLGREAK